MPLSYRNQSIEVQSIKCDQAYNVIYCPFCHLLPLLQVSASYYIVEIEIATLHRN